jgi:hypothetical protein
LTQSLTRTRSDHTSAERTRVRGAVVGPAHSVGSRAQKSTHPGGGFVISKGSAGRSDPAWTWTTSIALAASAASITARNFVATLLQTMVMIVNENLNTPQPAALAKRHSLCSPSERHAAEDVGSRRATPDDR